MDSKTEYAKQNEEKHKRKIILPNDISWEYGSNKFATQKGKLKITSTKELSESNDGVVPHLTCPPLHFPCASQAKSNAFGNIREQVTKVVDNNGEERIQINKIVNDKMTETILKKWDQPNKIAKNSDIGEFILFLFLISFKFQIYSGKRRDALTETSGGRRLEKKEQIKCLAAIPRFHDPRQTMAAKGISPGQSYQPACQKGRQATMSIEGLNRTTADQLDSNRYMAWLGGQLTLQSQSQTGGFNKNRDVVSNNYYSKVDQTQMAKELREKLGNLKIESEEREEEQLKNN
ncbi:unnamed protein product [Caenorhabditis bovis]|uniref:Uncharacterized protein n=1 Tax=Caenorhabditis bovis TaxID=2654633 RepID=A0A8S1EN41_9PELO|nr:unnamed protein product [Caenorhabditis bovis]